MQFTNYWQQFEHTGRVEDYLNYLQNAENRSSSDTRKRRNLRLVRNVKAPWWIAERRGVQTCPQGRLDHAGIPVCNGNCIKTDTFR